MISRRIGRYEIDRLLGEGGVGRVYAAHDTLLGRQVAIKTLRPEASRNRDFIERFINEAKSFSDLRHPNITGLYDLDLGAQPPHMVMELIDGHTLEELLEWGPLPERECLAVIAQVADGLTAAHHKGVIHRDVKPSNLMVTESGLLKIMDFGIARVRGSQRLTRADQVFATLLYASPEQLRGGDVDERSDIYNLAAVAYEMLAGRPPFVADNDADLRTAQLEMQPPPLAPLVPRLDRRIESALLQALAKNPEDRFTTAEKFAAAIGASAIRRDATDILQGFFVPLLRRVSETHETKLVSLPDGLPPAGAPIGNGAENVGASIEGPAALHGNHRGRSMVAPIAALGGALVALVMGIAYVTLAPPTRPTIPSQILEQKTGIVPPSSPPASDRVLESKTTPLAQPLPPQQPNPQMQEAVIVQQPSVQPLKPAPKPEDALLEPSVRPLKPPPEAETRVDEPIAVPPPKLAEEPKLAAIPPPSVEQPNPNRFDPAIIRTPPPLKHRYPEGPAQLEGVITNFGSAEWIFVDGRKVRLYGIEDNARTPAELLKHQGMISGYLHRGETYVVCYQRPGNTYRCYADNEDVADAALNARIAKRSGGTP